MVYAIINIKDIGTVKAELFLDVPNSTANFVSLAESEFYNGLTMHRIVNDFVAQGGCPSGTGTGGPGYTIDGEFKSNGFDNPHSHVKGALSFARSMARNSAGSQFYLALDDVKFLDDDYAVFGQTVEGFDVLDKLNQLGTQSGTPTQNVVIESVKIERDGEEIPEVIKV